MIEAKSSNSLISGLLISLKLILLTLYLQIIQFSECYTCGRNALYGLSTFRHLPLDTPENMLKKVGISSNISSGFQTYLPFGQTLMDKLQNYIESKFVKRLGAAKAKFPSIIPHSLISSKRKLEFGELLFNVLDRNNRKYYLSPTSEEVVSEVVSQSGVFPKRSKPIYLFQCSEKYRDELRPCFSSLRLREFLMFDLYSFHSTSGCLDSSFKNITEVYREIFRELKVDAIEEEKEGGTQVEFLAMIGDKKVEIGHLFKLPLEFTEKISSSSPTHMGSYGIGLLRLLTSTLWAHRDPEGLAIPPQLNPYSIAFMESPEFSEIQQQLHSTIGNAVGDPAKGVLVDDREGKLEDKLRDLWMLGVPRVVISTQNGVCRYLDRGGGPAKHIPYS